MKFVRSESKLDEQIDTILEHMSQCDPSTEKYSSMLSDLERLVRLKKEEKVNRVSPDTLAIVVGNLVGILVIVGAEYRHVIGSRATGFVLRPNLRSLT